MHDVSLVGRVREREAIAAALQALPGSAGGVVAIDGEPGIGKSRLLAHLVASAEADRCTVLGARASEFERDLPYALWSEALDDEVDASGDRHRTHRALRTRLEGLAAPRPAVLWMDDVQWADRRIDRGSGRPGAPAARGAGAVRGGRTRRADAGRRGGGARRRPTASPR